jgi:hypothetical protein
LSSDLTWQTCEVWALPWVRIHVGVPELNPVRRTGLEMTQAQSHVETLELTPTGEGEPLGSCWCGTTQLFTDSTFDLVNHRV